MPARVSQRDGDTEAEMQEGATMKCSPESEFAGKKEVEKDVWRCLNSVDHLMRRRKGLDLTLRQGWMELVCARYEMGPARISHPLFSLKPQAGQAVIDISHQAGDEKCGAEESSKGPLIFDLIKNTERTQKVVPYARENNGKKNPSSQLRRRPVSILAECANDEKDGILEYQHLINDSYSDDDPKPLKGQKDRLQGFGALVSPHLRSAQGTFFKALQLAMELLNAQNESMDAHGEMSCLQASTCTSV